MANTEILENFLRLLTFFLIFTVNAIGSQSVVRFEPSFNDKISISNHKVFRRDAPGSDEKCSTEKQKLISLLNTTTIDDYYTFTNETKYAMALAWAGENDGTLIIVTTEEQGGVAQQSTVYRSVDFGKSYSTIDKTINTPIKKHNGLQRNPFDAKKVYLIGGTKTLYVTEDGGVNFDKIELSFTIMDDIIFHSNKEFDKYLLARDMTHTLYISTDNGHQWEKALTSVGKVFWGIVDDNDGKKCDTPTTIYAASTENLFLSALSMSYYTLKKSTNGGKDWMKLLDNVVSYERLGNFLYASVLIEPDNVISNRLLRISKDCGATWNDAQLPTIEPDRFYRVMDIESNMIFMHVDDATDSGHGTLYTSAAQGVVYSESLPRHLYPNYGEIHDFYKVKSIRGVYITSQMKVDDSIHSVISYNRGATWEKIKRPEDAPCKDESKDCFLQIHGMYSIKRSINTSLPLSEETAVGLILAHGHVADALQKTNPDVYISSDGGYNWRLSLKGPHQYSIGDHGGLIVAITKEDPTPKVIKFSTDEGRCWHEYTFTNTSLRFTGLLTEPEGKSLVVMIWGYLSDTKKWEVHVIDFKDVIKQQCSDSDYEPWLAHQSYQGNNLENIGCILGMKETFLRLKKDSFCYNGYNHEKLATNQLCKCTREDYECDYGYFRPGGSDECVKIANFQHSDIDICLRGHEEKLVSTGYRKIPGDQCTGGFSPSTRTIDLNKVCDEAGKPNFPKKKTETVQMSRGVKIFAVIIVILVMALAAVMGVYFLRRYVLLRNHQVEYRYSMLNQSADQNTQDNGDWSDDLDQALSSAAINYQDSDEELTTTTVQPSKSRRSQPSRQNGAVKPRDTNPFGSYHDDSDDDLLS